MGKSWRGSGAQGPSTWPQAVQDSPPGLSMWRTLRPSLNFTPTLQVCSGFLWRTEAGGPNCFVCLGVFIPVLIDKNSSLRVYELPVLKRLLELLRDVIVPQDC